MCLSKYIRLIMKTINFTANSNDTSLQGILIVSNIGSKIFFDDTLAGKSAYDLKETDIKDHGNFIASFIRRLDKEEIFESITLDDEQKTFMIKRDDPKSEVMRLYKKPNDDGVDVVTEDDCVSIYDIYGNKIDISVTSLGFEPIDVPKNFKYTKNPVLNLIYQNSILPHDFNRKMSSVITKEISKRQKNSNGKPWAFWCAKSGQIQNESWNGKLHNAVFVSSELLLQCESVAKMQGDISD